MGAMGKLFARYFPRRVKVKYTPAVGADTDGLVYLVYYAEPKTPAPTSAADCTKATKCITAPAWHNLSMDIPISPARLRLLTRTGDNTPASSDYDYGVFYAFGIGAGTADAVIGTLGVEFDYDMYDPVDATIAPS
jgi:hypothetical protein